MTETAVRQFSDEARAELDAIVARFPEKQPALLSVLRLAEREFGVLDPSALRGVADALELTPAHVWGVFTFYSLFRTAEHGRFIIDVCATLPCALRGARDIVHHLESRLGIAPGETTDDGQFTMRTVECLARCDQAPMLQINFEDNRYRLTPEAVDTLLDELRAVAPAQKSVS